MATINAIETRYAGCRFRSRLEARWAVFFDTLGVAWQYESEGFDLAGRTLELSNRWIEGGYYLPDFFLPELDTWFEVKGVRPTAREWELALLLEASTGQRVAIAWGDIPRSPDHYGQDLAWQLGQRGISGPTDCADYAWCVCPVCGNIGIEFEARAARVHERGSPCPHAEVSGRGHAGNHPRLLAAYEAARSARFEHGERGLLSTPGSRRRASTWRAGSDPCPG